MIQNDIMSKKAKENNLFWKILCKDTFFRCDNHQRFISWIYIAAQKRII